ncbi:MAG: sulfonate transport system permease protein [Alphaproteobacteria bacterium]|jgi:NitT/TauT family transport system permease protein|nr:sulfonate transport system permease protein [Alphaproteobacteria bacterium]
MNVAVAHTGPKTRARKRKPWRAGLLLTQIGILVVLLSIWQFAVSDASLPYFSRPTVVMAKLYELLTHGEIYRHIAVTLSEIAIGYALGAGVGLVLGFTLGRSRFLSAALQPYIIGLYSIPKIALAPVFIIWLGLGMASKVAVVFLASFFLVFFNTYSGLLAINEELVRLARLMGASWPQTVARVILPAAAHQIFLGLKTAVPYAVIGAVIGEYIGSSEGLGYYILYASQTYDAPALFSGIIILVVIVFLVNFGLNWLEARVIRWRQAGGQTVQL